MFRRQQVIEFQCQAGHLSEVLLRTPLSALTVAPN